MIFIPSHNHIIILHKCSSNFTKLIGLLNISFNVFGLFLHEINIKHERVNCKSWILTFELVINNFWHQTMLKSLPFGKFSEKLSRPDHFHVCIQYRVYTMCNMLFSPLINDISFSAYAKLDFDQPNARKIRFSKHSCHKI